MNKIPKKIHYCWFGGKDKPKYIIDYIDTWSKMNEYEIIEWNEQNFNIEECDFIKSAYENKKWAFVSDYVRLSVLQKHGGIYLDTDVEIIKPFDEFLEEDMFLGYIYNCSLGTAVIGAKKNHPIISGILELYKTAEFKFIDNKIKLKFKGYEEYQINNNNDLFTVYFIKNVDGFLLSNKKQKLEDITIYPKEYFERRTFSKSKDFSIHHCDGSWYKSNPSKKSKVAKILRRLMGNILYDKLRTNLKLRRLPYYYIYKAHKKSYEN